MPCGVGFRAAESRNVTSKLDVSVQQRQARLPITTTIIESTIKQINRRMKGTKKFWRKPPKPAARLPQITHQELTNPVVHPFTGLITKSKRMIRKTIRETATKEASCRWNPFVGILPLHFLGNVCLSNDPFWQRKTPWGCYSTGL